MSMLQSLAIEKLDVHSFSELQVVKVWVGDFVNLEKDVWRVVHENKADLGFLLTHLLIHHQVDLVHRLFTSGQPGPSLIEQYLPIYYATQLLTREAHLTSIKIPPEIKETVNDLLSDIYQKRDFYYNTNEAAAYLRTIE